MSNIESMGRPQPTGTLDLTTYSVVVAAPSHITPDHLVAIRAPYEEKHTWFLTPDEARTLAGLIAETARRAELDQERTAGVSR